MKRTDSFQIKEDIDKNKSEDNIRVSEGHIPHNQIKKEDIVLTAKVEKHHNKSQLSHEQRSSFYQRKEKIPAALKQSIMKNSIGRKPNMNQSKIGRMIREKIVETFVCGICECEYKIKEQSKITKCDHVFCDSCLQHYVIYKIGMFEEVVCPEESCDLVLDTESDFFKNNLPKDVCKKYEKVHAFYLTAKNPNLRMCPNEKCENGILELIEGVNPKCKKCGKVYCEKCMFPEHPGKCDKNEVDFFQNNLHYRQCRKCKNVIERTQGCNHMTCVCKHQFCYLCGKDWKNNGHLCNPNDGEEGGNNNNFQDENPCQCCVCCDPEDCCGIFCSVLVKIFLLFPLFLLILIGKFIITIFPLALLFMASIFLGATGFTCELICNQENCCISLLLLILLPFSMIGGIVMAFGEVFCPAAADIIENNCGQTGDICENMLCW